MINKLLYIVNDKKIIDDLKKVGVKNFLFPLKDFCVGFNNTYDFDEIENESFIFINRILDNESLDLLEKKLNDNRDKIKGIVYDDFGVLYLINKLKLNVITVNYQNHFGTNYQSINENLKYNDSVVVSTDITRNEIEEILKKVEKEVCIFLFGLIPVMYSRRTLLTNFSKEFNIPTKNNALIDEKISKNKFIMVENAYGTVGYQRKYYDGLELLNLENIKYFLVNPLFLSDKEQIQLISDIKNKKLTLNIPTDKGFLYKETIYKLREDK